jgi:ferredoxin
MKIELKIDGELVLVEAGTTVLEAARQVGVEIPTLCHLPGNEPITSCMVCMVKEAASGKMIPSCSAVVAEGMHIETSTDEVRASRRAALELLLSDHLGDCEGPCQRACPVHPDVPSLIRQVAGGQMTEAATELRSEMALAGILGRLCSAPCERACRRNQVDQAVSIRLLHRFATDSVAGTESMPTTASRRDQEIAIVGSGPSGLAVAYHLALKGYACTILERENVAGGMLRQAVEEGVLAESLLEEELGLILRLGVTLKTGESVGDAVRLAALREEYAAVVLATRHVNAEQLQHDSVFFVGKKPGSRSEAESVLKTGAEAFPPPRRAEGFKVRAEKRPLVRAVADGKQIAAEVHAFLAGCEGAVPYFNSVIGRVRDEEKTAMMEGIAKGVRVVPAGGDAEGFNEAEAGTEAGRCMHCDCRKPATCKLRRYAAEYGARQQRYKPEQRRVFEQVREHPMILFEQGKCISCGICIAVARAGGEAQGLTFVGRGMATRLAVPFGATWEEALVKTAEECVAACPPLVYGCKFLNFSRSRSVLDLATRKAIKEMGHDAEGDVAEYADCCSEKYGCMIKNICDRLKLTSLKYQRLDDLVEAIGLPKEKLCTYCWDGVE